MDVVRPHEPPLTDNAPPGPDMIFTEEQVDGIVTVLHDVRQSALPDGTGAQRGAAPQIAARRVTRRAGRCCSDGTTGGLARLVA